MDRIPLPVLVWLATTAAGLLDDYATFLSARKSDPSVRWSWLPFLRRVVLIPLGAGGAMLGAESL